MKFLNKELIMRHKNNLNCFELNLLIIIARNIVLELITNFGMVLKFWKRVVKLLCIYVPDLTDSFSDVVVLHNACSVDL